VIKSEPEEVEMFGDLYPEVRLSEDEETMSVTLTLTHDLPFDKVECQSYESTDLEVSGNPHLSTHHVKSLIRDMEGKLSPAEVHRSVGCFVPVIRLQNESPHPLPTVAKINQNQTTTTPRQRKVNKKARPQNLKVIFEPRRTKVAKTEPGVKVKVTTVNRKRSKPLTNPKPKAKEPDSSPMKSETAHTKKVSKIKAEFGRTEDISSVPMEKEDKPNRSCETCSKKFRTENALLHHHQKPHENGDAGTTCRPCDLDLKNPNCLRVHLQEVHGKLPKIDSRKIGGKLGSSTRVCEIEMCNKTFLRASALRCHRRKAKHLQSSAPTTN